MDEEAEMSADKLKEKLNNWFSEKENKQTLRTFLRSLILNKLSKEDVQLDLKLKNVGHDNIDIAIVYFVCDFLAQNHFHYSLSVFSSEISSTKLHDYVCDYFTKISYKWNPNKPPSLEYYTVHNILSSLNINPTGLLGSEIINRYYLLCEGSLLKVVASAMNTLNNESDSSYNQKDNLGDSFPVKINGSHSTGRPNSHMLAKDVYPIEEIEKYFNKKEQRMQRRLSSQKQEFSRCKRILLSCHNALNVKLSEIHNLMAHLNSQKHEIISQLETIKNYSKEQLSVVTVDDRHEDHAELIDKAVMVKEILRDSCCQTKVVTVDKGIETWVEEVSSISIGTQTDLLDDTSVQDQLELEKTELIQFIEQQQERINSLTVKTMELTTKISSAQSSIPDHTEYADRGTLCRPDDAKEQSDVLLEFIDRSEIVMKKFNYSLEIMKRRTIEVEKNYSSFLDVLLNTNQNIS